MQNYVQKRIPTKQTTQRRLKLTRVLAGASLTLALVSCTYSNGHKQDYAPTASPKSLLIEDTVKSSVYDTVVAKYSSYEVTLVCQTVWGEAQGCSPEEQALVVGCICNRADKYNKSIEEIVTADSQFHGYNEDNPVTPEIHEVVCATLEAWARGESAPVYAPYATSSEYVYFTGDGAHNWFREEW